MPKGDKSEKEGDVFDGKLYKDAKHKVERIRRLTALSNALKDKEQDEDAVKELKAVARALVDPSLVNSEDKDVRLLAACCIADIIRLFAPNAPYSEDELKIIFGLFIEQLQGLEKPRETSYTKVFYLLEKLALVKAFILLVGLDDDMLVQLFKNLLSIASTDHSTKALSYMKDVMAACIDESDVLSNELLEVVLERILPDARAQSETGSKLAQNLISQCAVRLQNPVLQYLSDMITGVRSASELKDNAHEVIYELYKISPVVVREVLPQLDSALKVDDEKARKSAVDLLAKIFSAKNPIDAAHRGVLSSFLSRLNDQNVEIRLATVTALQPIIANHPEVVDADLQRGLISRVRDADERIRRAALPAVTEIAKAATERVTTALIEASVERLRDRKPIVRGEAVKQLGSLYAALSSRYQDNWPEAVLNVFGLLPRKLVASYAVDDAALKFTVERVIDNELLPADVDGASRATALKRLLSHLDDVAVNQLVRLLQDKHQIQQDFLAFLELKKTKSDENDDATKKMNRVAGRLPFSIDKSNQALGRLDFKHEPALLKALQALARVNASYKELRAAKQAALKAAGKNNIFEALVQRLSSTLVSVESVAELLDELRSSKSTTVRLFLEKLAQSFPSLFGKLTATVKGMIEGNSETLVDSGLVLAARIGEHFDQATANELRKQFIGFATQGSAHQAKHSVRAIIITFKNHEELLKGLSKKLNSAKVTDEHLEAVLASRTQIATQMPQLAKDSLTDNLEFVREVLAHEPDRKSGRPTGAAKALALKLLVRALKAQPSTEHLGLVLKLLTALVKARGDPTSSGTTSGADAELLRKYALSGLLYLARTLDGSFTPADFLQLVWSVHDTSVEVREHVLNKLNKYLSGSPMMHVKYLTVFAMFAGDRDKPIAHKAKQYFEAAVHRYREALRSLAGKSDARHATLLLPEYALPYVVYALAYRPDFTSDKDYRNTAIHLSYFLSHLQQPDSMVFIDQLLKYIKVAESAISKLESTAFRVICDIALKIHHSRQSNQKFTANQIYPAQIYLPQQLYKVVAGSTGQDKSYLPAGWHLPDLRRVAVAGIVDDESSRHAPSPAKKAAPAKSGGSAKKRRVAKEEAESEASASSAEQAREPSSPRRTTRARTSVSPRKPETPDASDNEKAPARSPAKSPAKAAAKRATEDDEPRLMHGRKKKKKT